MQYIKLNTIYIIYNIQLRVKLWKFEENIIEFPKKFENTNHSFLEKKRIIKICLKR